MYVRFSMAVLCLVNFVKERGSEEWAVFAGSQSCGLGQVKERIREIR